MRDQAILGIAVYQHFPKYYEYFQTRSFQYGKRTYGNHNRLLGSGGVDGIKTGYTSASGYNLLTAARNDGRHIVVVGFGFDSANAAMPRCASWSRTTCPRAAAANISKTAMIPAPGRKGSVANPTLGGGDDIEIASLSAGGTVIPMPVPSFRQGQEQDVELSEEASAAAARPVIAEGDTRRGHRAGQCQHPIPRNPQRRGRSRHRTGAGSRQHRRDRFCQWHPAARGRRHRRLAQRDVLARRRARPAGPDPVISAAGTAGRRWRERRAGRSDDLWQHRRRQSGA